MLGLARYVAGSRGFSPASLFSGGETGFWYDPTDIQLAWRRNLLTYTEQFDNAAWVLTAASISANATIAPDGTSTADKLIDTAAATYHYIRQSSFTPVASTIYTGSVYVKAAERTFASVQIVMGGVNSMVGVNLSTGATTTPTAGSVLVTSLGDGWYRVAITVTTSSTSIGGLYVYTATSLTNDPTYTGDGTSGIFVWGAQLELGSTASNYQQIVTPEISYLTYQPQPVMYTDSAGTTPVTGAEQAVGLILDKSKNLALGPELVTNGDFSSGSTGWTASAGVVFAGGTAAFPNAATNTENLFQSLPLVAGLTYSVTIVGSGQVNYRIDTADSASGPVTLPVTLRLSRASYTASRFQLYNVTGSAAVVDSISVKALPGNHAFQTTSAKRPVLKARYNVITQSETFSNAAWLLSNVTVTTGRTDPNGGTTAALITASGGTGDFYQTFAVGGTATFNQEIWVRRVAGTGAIQLVTPDNGRQTVTITSSWAKYATTYTQTSVSGTSSGYCGIRIVTSGDQVEIAFVDVRALGTRSSLLGPTYQRIAAATDYDVAGFLPYLQFDGLDDALTTNSIDFSATDKMTVFAGVRNLSATAGMFCELSPIANSNTGSFYITTSEVTSGDFTFRLNGTPSAAGGGSVATSAVPITQVMSSAMNLAGLTAAAQNAVRINGVNLPYTLTAGVANGGNFGNYPLFVGARNQTGVYFNGWLTQLIGVGAATSASQIVSTESWVNVRTGAY